MLSNEHIIKVVNSVCEGKCVVTFKQSLTSRSIYFIIYKGTCRYIFRISDHRSYSHIKSFVITDRTKSDAIERFVKNRLNSLGDMSLDALLGIKRGHLPRCAYLSGALLRRN